MKPLLAYEVREPDEGHCVIRFATSSAAARRTVTTDIKKNY